MYTTLNEFIMEWTNEGTATQKLLDALTDSSLAQQVSPNDRTLGRIAWHIVTSIPVWVFGLTVEGGQDVVATPSSAKEIAGHFQKIHTAVLDIVSKQWTEDSLNQVCNVFGMDMPLKASLPLVIKHLIHHRGQMTVLMRQAGLMVPGVYGPAREEWAAMGLKAPEV